MKTRRVEYLSIAWLCVSTIVLIALQVKPWGFGMLALGLILLRFCSKDFRKHVVLAYGGAAVLGLAPIGTSTDFPQGTLMGVALFLVVFVPYFIGKYMYKNDLVRFPFRTGLQWKKKEVGYVAFTAIAAYLVLPLMLRSSDSYLNWQIEPGFFNLAISYVGLNVVGIWDELFFVSTLLGIFRKHLPFWMANLAQAVFFTSFLYALGFEGWGPLVIFPFALTQGYVFKKTDSLLYVLTIHLTIDLVLHLTLVRLHHPEWLPF